jgi:hypothetical protein
MIVRLEFVKVRHHCQIRVSGAFHCKSGVRS